ncbi:MAG: site-2 protease family protein [Candidatus Marinimicrobia bacterium]|nr:site-2 protease family protein [Candidatus Neomarinimicrobiota bacterium]
MEKIRSSINFILYKLKFKQQPFADIPLRKPNPWVNLALFLTTVVTTIFAGTLLENKNPLESPGNLVYGLPFSLTLLLILGSHEMGHYLFARKNKVDVSLPYFIPAPTIIGTFGAVIKMRSPIYDKRALIEIGAAGPIVGFFVAVPAYIIGLVYSEILPVTEVEGGIQLGDSLLTKFLAFLVYPNIPEGHEIYIHSIGFAAWIGMIVTMLNLLPVGQLDGGHILYAILGEKHKRVGYAALALIATLGILLTLTGTPGYNWLLWAALVLIFIRVKHPPVYNSHMPIPEIHKIICLFAFLIFILTFIPVPFKF